VSSIADSIFDHPFQWGSKRTGPDLAREGGRYPHLWHYQHMIDPRRPRPAPTCRRTRHLATDTFDASRLDDVDAMRTLGIPYTAAQVTSAAADAATQGRQITEREGVTVAPDTQLVALIAYLQRLGR
jgi:cytochrome c oxidase cbb3-type subunit I/II